MHKPRTLSAMKPQAKKSHYCYTKNSEYYLNFQTNF
jgi:hypothetical protein